MLETERRCLKCLMSSVKDGKVIYDYPNEDGNSPDCDTCLGTKTEDCDKDFALTDGFKQREEGR
ncbi:hypothetical protein HZB97_03490 [Candidatus Gottesmanbacteria bacterium]|nr:hypothetical protein [Candidatus Gottesmanbacteria bacterium]